MEILHNVREKHKLLNSKTMLGKDNFLFLICDTNNEIMQHFTPENCTQEYKEKIFTTLETRTKVFENMGIQYLFFVIPDKSVVYNDLLPDPICNMPMHRHVTQLQKYFKVHSSIKFVDLFPAYHKHKNTKKLFYKYDTHHNNIGSYYAYGSIIEELIKLNNNTYELNPACGLEMFEFFKYVESNGDLLMPTNMGNNVISLDNKESDDIRYIGKYLYQYVDPPEKYANEEPKKTICTEFLDQNVKLPRVVIFRDSSCTSLIHLLSNHFKRATYVWNYGSVNMEIVKSEKPDLVLSIMTERFLDYVHPIFL